MNNVKAKFRSSYDGTNRAASDAAALDFQAPKDNPNAAKQAFKDECDVNRIMAKYRRTGELPSMIKAQPKYGDFSDAETYQESLNRVLFAQEQFDALPALVRERFANDPSRFLAFASDGANMEEMVKMGLATRRPVEPAPDPEPAPKPKAKSKTPPSDSSEE